MRLLPLPADRCLEALRQALKLVLAPEAHSPLAKHYAHLAEMLLARWIAVETQLPQIEGRHAAANDDLLHRSLEALRAMGPPTAQAPTAVTLPEALNRLAAVLPHASGQDAATIRAIMRDAVNVDAGARRAFEAAVAEVSSAAPLGESAKQWGIDREVLQGYLNERFAGPEPIRVRSVNPLPGGRSKQTVLFEIDEHPQLPSSMVIRMDVGRYGTSVRAEFPLIKALHREGLPVPDPLWLEDRAELFGGAFMVTRRMPGAPPGTLWDVGAASHSIGLALADALGRVHALPVRRLMDAASEMSQPLVQRMLAESEARWRERMPTPSVAMEAAYCWMAQQARTLNVPAALVHGDAGFQNMIVDNGALQCLLDWEFAHPGDPAEDLAYCRPAVEKIMPWDDFLTRYRQSGGPPVTQERLQFFEIWRCLRNATLAANTLFDVRGGTAGGLEMAAIAVNTYPKLEAQLAASLDKILATTPP